MDLNRELRTVGVANMLTGVCGGMMGFVSLSLSRLPLKMGARGRVIGLVSAAVCALVLWHGTGFLAYVPKFALGGVLFFLGLGFLMEWLVEGWNKLPRTDYGVVLLIFLVVGCFGYLEGVGVGVIAAAGLFVVGYSRVNVIASTLTGAEHRSNVDRSVAHTRVLGEKGIQTFILKLQGFVFFGSANKLLDSVRRRALNPALRQLRYVVLDFQRVTGLDSSAVLCLVKMKNFAAKEKITLVFTLLSPEIRQQLERGGLDTTPDDVIQIFRDRDHGIEWCENQILERESALLESASLGRALSDDTTTTLPLSELQAYLERQELPAGQDLMRQGDPASELFFLESGRVSVYLELANGHVIRLRTLNEGTVVGELGLYLGTPRTASIRTDQPCVVHRLTAEALKRMELDSPALASAFHRFMTRMLAERLSNSNRALQAVLE
jgi:SulP family sulfate permease